MAVDTSMHPADVRADRRPLLGGWLRFGWVQYLLLALLMGAYSGTISRIGNLSVAAWKPYVWEYSSALIDVAMIPFIVKLERRFNLDSRPRARIIAVNTAAILVFSAVHVTIAVALRKLAYVLAGESYIFAIPTLPLRLFSEFQRDAVVYLIILLAAFAIRDFQVRREGELRAVKLSAELGQAQLQHLTAQIEPHFLFNALNTISNRMREDIDAADRMISQLGDLLRAAYDTSDEVVVPLGRELKWLQDYAAMMVARYRGQLAFDLDVEPDLEAVRVPRLLLQPIVENAFRHGLPEGRGRLSVDVRRIGMRLCYTISDDGVGLSGDPLARGIGLSNVSRRLSLLFADDHQLSFREHSPRGTIVTVQFPVSSPVSP